MINNGKIRLGRGLEALIKPAGASSQDEVSKQIDDIRKTEQPVQSSSVGSISNIAIKDIFPNPFQPRTEFEPVALQELKESIRINGLIQPVTVREWNNAYQLISGERRLRACQELQYREIPAYIISVNSDEVMLALALIENIQRERLNAIEVALAYRRLIEECNLTQEQVAVKVAKDRSTVANSIRLLKLPLEIQEAITKEQISMGHARALINIPDTKIQLSIFRKVVVEGLSVRSVEQLVRKLMTGNKGSGLSGKTKKSSAGSSSVDAVEDKLRRLYSTKVSCRNKLDGSGEIVFEYYNLDDLERLLEIFENASGFGN